MWLSELNKHPKDADIEFFEGPHEYYIKEKKVDTSVTTCVHSVFPAFNSKAIAEKTHAKRYNDKNSDYYGKTVEEILEMWDKNREESARKGTELHYGIEMYYNGQEVSEDTKETKEWSFFMQWVSDSPHLKMYRTEWFVYDADIDIAGSIDAVYINEDGTLDICDWKRSK